MDNATFMVVKNVLQDGKIHPCLKVIYCRDCCPFHLKDTGNPLKPLDLAKLIKNRHINSEELEDIQKSFKIVKKVADNRQTKYGKELEVVFYGSDKSLWIKAPAGSVAASTAFFLISNFGVWISGWYSLTLGGLAACYVNAIPFYGYTLVGDLAFTGILFGAYELSRRASKSQINAQQVAL